jgi:hypothetical protein
MNDRPENIDKTLKKYLYITILIVTVFYVYYFLTKFERTIKIKQLYLFGERQITSNMVSDYENKIYKINNQPLLLNFDSAETLSKLYAKKSYKIHGFGIRVPFLSLYENITHVELLN